MSKRKIRKQFAEDDSKARWLRVNLMGHDANCSCLPCLATVTMLLSPPSWPSA